MDDTSDDITPRLLVIDDNPNIHKDIRKILEAKATPSELDALDAELFGDNLSETPGQTFAIDSAYQGQEGLALLQQAVDECRPYLVAIVDMRMPPGWDGVQTIQRLWEVDPDLQVVICTAYSDHSWEELASQLETRDRLLILKKPFDVMEIRQMTHALSQKRILCEALAEANSARYKVLYDDNPAMFLTVSDDFRIVSANRYGAAYMGYRVSDLEGKSAQVLYASGEWEVVRAHITKCFQADQQDVQQWETRKQRHDGTLIWARESARMIVDPEFGASLLLVCEDITSRRQAEEKLSHEASHDVLTGLANRRAFERAVHRVLDIQNATRQHALCFIDLDQFKVVNDTCNHQAGDELLRQIGDLLATHVRKSDTVARLGGDEFGLLLEDCPIEAARKKIQLLHDAIGRYRFTWEDKSFVIGASMGLVPITGTGNSVSESLRAADSACYLAKDGGRNRICVAQVDGPELAKQHVEMEWSTRILWALEHDRLCLYYQPIVPSDGGSKKTHVEVLVRMRGEDGKIILPGAFLPSAQRYGLMVRLDRWVVQTALEWLAANHEILPDLHMCCINLSGQAICDDTFVEFLRELLANYESVSSKICFEITETAAITNMSRAVSFMEQLKALGCRFALDDFGSGYSSFAYLRELPVDFLKIDGCFVKGIDQDNLDLLTVKSICEVGSAMGIQTIAEFVSSEAIHRRLLEIGIHYVQGYLLGRPAPLEGLLADIGLDPETGDRTERCQVICQSGKE